MLPQPVYFLCHSSVLLDLNFKWLYDCLERRQLDKGVLEVKFAFCWGYFPENFSKIFTMTFYVTLKGMLLLLTYCLRSVGNARLL